MSSYKRKWLKSHLNRCTNYIYIKRMNVHYTYSFSRCMSCRKLSLSKWSHLTFLAAAEPLGCLRVLRCLLYISDNDFHFFFISITVISPRNKECDEYICNMALMPQLKYVVPFMLSAISSHNFSLARVPLSVMCNLKFQRGGRFRTSSMRNSSLRTFLSNMLIGRSLLLKWSSSSSSMFLPTSSVSSSTKTSCSPTRLFRMIEPLSIKIWRYEHTI